MPRELRCVRCQLYLGEMGKGKLRNNSVLLCADCWGKAEIAIQMADLAACQTKESYKNSDMPEFLKDMLDGKEPRRAR